MILKLIPPQFRLFAIGFAVSFLFGLGWTVNGWRLSGKIADLEADLATCQGNTITLTASIKGQNAQIKTWKTESDKKLKASQDALRVAREGATKTATEIGIIAKMRGDSCQDAENLINVGLGL